MNALWSYFWPVFALALLVGTIAGLVAWRPGARTWRILAIGGVAMVLAALLWHGPLGGGDRLAASTERFARQTVVYYEVPHIQARLQREPMSRHMLLSGEADAFQRRELTRMMTEIPGVSSAGWGGRGTLPLFLEAAVVGLIAFLLGALLAYGVSVRRRRNAQWRW